MNKTKLMFTHWTWLGGTPTGGYPTSGTPHQTRPGGTPMGTPDISPGQGGTLGYPPSDLGGGGAVGWVPEVGYPCRVPSARSVLHLLSCMRWGTTPQWGYPPGQVQQHIKYSICYPVCRPGRGVPDGGVPHQTWGEGVPHLVQDNRWST